MKSTFQILGMFCLIAMFTLPGCAGPEESTADIELPVAGGVSQDPLSGSWTGDWGPSETHRNPVTLELQWDGTALSGTLNPGPDAITLTKGSYAGDTNKVMMEADAKDHNGEMVHYMIEGDVSGATMTGTWSHGDKKGDFKITKN